MMPKAIAALPQRDLLPESPILHNDTKARSTGDGGLYVPSSLWIDQPDAPERIETLRAVGQIDDGMARDLSFFVENGYVVLDLEVGKEVLDGVVEAAEQAWRDKPADLAYAYDGPARRMVHADESRERRSRYRIHDLHSHSDAAHQLYLNRQLHDFVRAALGEEPVAIQSLFFEFGSQQLLHRDPVVVPIGSPGHLLAAWIALEDIHPDCGPLVYIPGSHRLPYFELAPGEWEYDGRRMGPEVIEKGMAWEEEQYRRHGLERQHFTPKKGQALIWHASLTHGGSEVRDEALTRKSFVVHYSSRSTYPERSITIAEPGSPEVGGEQQRVLATRELLELEGRLGFLNPMQG